MELFEAILYQAIVIRGLKRGLFMYPGRVTLSYLVYRVAHEPANGNSLLGCMRIVVEVVGETGSHSDGDSAAVEVRIKAMLVPVSRRQLTDIVRWEGEVSEAEYEKCLITAGIRTNSLSIVQKSFKKNTGLMTELRYLQSYNSICGCYDKLVALYGGPEMMEYLMTLGTPTVNGALRVTLFTEAARAGRADIVRHVYDFKRDGSRMGHTVLHDAQNTVSVEVLRFVARL
jgi:hypothetical protein